MKYQVYLFDLDGTLTDPFEGITKSVQYALKHFGIHEPNLNNLRNFIGPPLKQTIEETYHLTPEQGDEALKLYRERFSIKGIYENKIYCGVTDMLRTLKQRGASIAIASSKPHFYVNKILIHFGIDSYFDAVSGSEMDGRRTDKAESILYALELLGVPVSKDVVMIGDRIHDARGAQQAGVDFVAAQYGYPDDGEFDSTQCVFRADSIAQLRAFLLEE